MCTPHRSHVQVHKGVEEFNYVTFAVVIYFLTTTYNVTV